MLYHQQTQESQLSSYSNNIQMLETSAGNRTAAVLANFLQDTKFFLSTFPRQALIFVSSDGYPS